MAREFGIYPTNREPQLWIGCRAIISKRELDIPWDRWSNDIKCQDGKDDFVSWINIVALKEVEKRVKDCQHKFYFESGDGLYYCEADERNSGGYLYIGFGSTGKYDEMIKKLLCGECKMEIKTWADMDFKYPQSRHEMTKTTERDFVNDCFNLYEKEGFAKRFWSPFEDLKDKIGKCFEVISRCDEKQNPLHTLPLWNIRFEDGTVSCVNPEEIIPSEMKANGCKLKDI